MNFDIGEVLARAWEITLNHKAAINLLLTALSVILYASGTASSSLGIRGVTLLVGEVISVVFLLAFGCMMLVGMASMGLGMIYLQPLFLLLDPALLLVYSLVIYFGIFIISAIVMLPFMAPFLFLPIMESSQAGFESQMFGWVLLVLSMILLPVLALIQGFTLTFMKSAFMIVYLRLTRSTALQPVVE